MQFSPFFRIYFHEIITYETDIEAISRENARWIKIVILQLCEGPNVHVLNCSRQNLYTMALKKTTNSPILLE